jgi:hypothetical protein
LGKLSDMFPLLHRAADPDLVRFAKRAFHERASHDYELVLPPLPREWVPAKRGDANGDAAGAALTLFLSAFGFFFSRLLLIWPFATSLSPTEPP